MHDAGFLLLLLLNRALFHAQDVADGVEFKLIAVLLADPLLDELVPIERRERSGTEGRRF